MSDLGKGLKSNLCDSCYNKSNKHCSICLLSPWNQAGINDAFGTRANKLSIQDALANSPIITTSQTKLLSMAEIRKRNNSNIIARPKMPHIIVPSANHISQVAKQNGMIVQ